MKKDYNVTIEDNGAAFIVVLNAGTDNRLVVFAASTLYEAWSYIVSTYRIETQIFTVGKNRVPVDKWVKEMEKNGCL